MFIFHGTLFETGMASPKCQHACRKKTGVLVCGQSPIMTFFEVRTIMCKKLIHLLPFVLLLSLVGSANGQVGKGNILFEYWFDYGGVNISDLTSIPDYPDNPDDSEWRTSFEGPLDTADNYGERAAVTCIRPRLVITVSGLLPMMPVNCG